MSAELYSHLIDSAILTVLVSLFVLWRYRVTVLAGMMRGAADVVALPVAPSRVEHRIGPGVAALRRLERRRQGAIVLAYLLTTLACALPLAWGVALSAGGRLYASTVSLMALVFTFACAPMIAASLALSPLRALIGLALLTLLLSGAQLLVFNVEVVARGGHLSWGDPTIFFHTAAGLWLVAFYWLATWPRKVRGVAPITFAGLLVFGFAPFLGARLSGAVAATSRLAPTLMFMLVALLVGALAWLRLHQLARAYERKRFSDAQLLARTWWLMLVVNVGFQAVTYGRVPWTMLAACAVAWLAFGPVNDWMFARLRGMAGETPPRTLLLLRVFGDAARSERLFDRLGARWRLLGPVTMIVAPDVAARTIHPGDYLRWLTGHLDESFVTSADDLRARLTGFDVVPDPDGRYRVDAFCCRDNTWQATVAELMLRADVVVMDVRGLTRSRRGSEFELRRLAGHYPPRQLVLVADGSTERAILSEVFGNALAEARLVDVTSRRDMAAVFRTALAVIA